MDRDSSSTFSSIVSVAIPSFKNNVAVFPNPVLDAATINLTSTINATVKLQLYDAKGQLVSSRRVAVNKGPNLFKIEMDKLSKGVYFISLSWGEETRQIQIIKN